MIKLFSKFKNFKNIRKYASESGSIEESITKEFSENGTSVVKKINVFKNWSKMGTGMKVFLGTYFSLFTSSYIFSTYSDGKENLLLFREGKLDSSILTDWQAAKLGCKKNVWRNFVESVIFPYTLFSNVMPSIVLKLNPKPVSPQQ